MDDSSEEDNVENEVAFLAKNFRKFLKMKKSGKSFSKGRFIIPQRLQERVQEKSWEGFLIPSSNRVLRMQQSWTSQEGVS